MIDEIHFNGELLAILISRQFDREGIHFFTSDNLSQQLGYIHYKGGTLIQPHVHNHITREVKYTQEVLFIRKGRLRADFYSSDQKYLESRILEAGDVLLLVSGGHGFEVLEEVEMFEVKQGPYMGLDDKERFVGIDSHEARVKR